MSKNHVKRARKEKERKTYDTEDMDNLIEDMEEDDES